MKTSTGIASLDRVAADRHLVDRCVAGDAEAWEDLYERFHDLLLVSIKLMFGPRDWDPNLIEEVAARVWYAVVSNDAQLLDQFDPARGCRLTTFLATIAKSEASVYFRSERRRRVRERIASRPDEELDQGNGDWTLAELREFVTQLTPKENAFLKEFLLTPSGQNGLNGHEHDCSDANRWKLASRVRKKLLEYLSI
jgi:DNA-directed RNA polymerase specialized sigma24 family protein